jgi:hypothetical protein
VTVPAKNADTRITITVTAIDAAGNSSTATQSFQVVSAETQATTSATHTVAKGGRGPSPVPAWYMTARGARDLRRQARSDACRFARDQPNNTRVLVMDFGKADRHNGHFGAQLRTGPHFSNSDILSAMKAGAWRYRNVRHCYSRGSVRITYGNTNNMPNWLGHRATRRAGHHQAEASHRLASFQSRHGFVHEGVSVAGDIEPQWNPPKITMDLAHAAAAGGRGGLYFNYGSATFCPPEKASCANHWSFRLLGNVSFGAYRRPLPEIYRPVHARQWTKVRRVWNENHSGSFCFYGATATPGFPLSLRESWNRLANKNPCVGRELVNIRNN